MGDAPTARNLPRGAWMLAVRRAFHGFLRHRGIDAAAALTFFSSLTLFPAALAVVSALALFYGPDDAVELVMGVAKELAQPETVEIIRAPLTELLTVENPGVALAIGVALGVWSLSAYATAFGRAMNGVFEVQEGRPIWKSRGTMLVLAVFLFAMFGMLVACLISTQRFMEAVGFTEPWPEAWQFFRWPLLILLPIVIVGILYYATPVVKHDRMRWVTHGAAVAIGAWALGTIGFAFYVSLVGQYDRVYGWLGGGIVLLLWLYLSNTALVIGGEINAEVVRLRLLSAGIPAEETIPLQMRDTKRTLMLARQRDADIADSRALREG